MYESITIENLAGFKSFKWKDIDNINILIGKNDTGKTHLLKILYSVAKSLEEYSKSSKPNAVQDTFNTILANKILWTFQPNAIGDIVTKRQNKLKVDTRLCNENYHFSFTHEATRKITDCSPDIKKIPNLQTFFIPPKEVITAFDAIAATREQLEIFGMIPTLT